MNAVLPSTIILLMVWIISTPGVPQKNVKLNSPDGRIEFVFRLLRKGPVYSIFFKGTPVVSDSELRLSFQEGGIFKSNLKILQPIFRAGEEKYALIVGKTKEVHERFREVTIPMQERAFPSRQINPVVRAFNDGMAFRYEFPQQRNWSYYALTGEHTAFRINGDPKVLALFLPNYTTSHEGLYSSLLLSEVKEDTLMDVSSLFEFQDGTYMAITEAALVDYAGMYLIKNA